MIALLGIVLFYGIANEFAKFWFYKKVSL
jgi:hypothetical protein